MSTSTVFTLPSSVEIARLVTPLKLASQRFVRWTVSIHTLGPVSVTRTRVAPPPYSVTFPSTVESVIETLEVAPSSRRRPGKPRAERFRALSALVTSAPPFAT